MPTDGRKVHVRTAGTNEILVTRKERPQEYGADTCEIRPGTSQWPSLLVPWLSTSPPQFKFRLSERKLPMARASVVERTEGFRKMSVNSQQLGSVPTASPSMRVTGINSCSLPSNPVRRHEYCHFPVYRGGVEAQRG